MNGAISVSGALTAMITPFKEDGLVDFIGLHKNLQFQIDQGISGIVPIGTTGEASTLTPHEHRVLLADIASNATCRTYVLAGCGSNCTAEALEYAELASVMKCQGILLVDPYYNGPSSMEIAKHYYEVIAKKFPDLSIVPYIIPGRTGCELLVEDLARLAWELPNIRAVKDATGNVEHMAKTRRLAPLGFAIFSGDDSLTFEAMQNTEIRANGVISVISNICPKAVNDLCGSIVAKDMIHASAVQKALEPLFQLVTVKAARIFEIVAGCGQEVIVQDKFRNPLPIKTMMNGLSIPAGPCRAPLGKMTHKGVVQVRKALKRVWAENPELLTPVQEFYSVDIGKRLKDNSIWLALCQQ